MLGIHFSIEVLCLQLHGFITNVVYVTAKSSDSETQTLIDELNKTYNIFTHYFNEKNYH